MKPFIIFLFLTFALFLYTKQATAQYFASTYKPKTKTEILVFAKLKSLAEIKEHFNHKISGGQPDIMIDPPDTSEKYYRFQVGFSYPDIFRTYYWLSIDPKTYKVYYLDIGVSDQTITLEQWRYWRTKPGWRKPHIFKAGKLVVLEDDQEKSSKLKK